MKTKYITWLLTATLFITSTACYKNEELDNPIKTVQPSDDPIDQYIQKNFTDKYGIAVRYKFVDRYVDPTKRVSPPEREVVKPMLDFLTEYWIEPFIQVPNGEKFFKRYVPSEMVFIGSAIFNGDGTITLGTADAGARITLTEVNIIDLNDENWVFRQLGTIYHEFAHIVHQEFGFPTNFGNISKEDYSSPGSWYNLTNDEALKGGFVSPYATSSVSEDFAETVAFLLYKPDFDTYIIQVPNCETADCEQKNEGRSKLKKKYDAILEHYKKNTGVDLLVVRDSIQAKLSK